MVGLSFITFTRNSADKIEDLLEHVRDIVDEIIVVDGYSSDDTVEIAKRYGAKVYQRKPWGYPDPDRMFALRHASYAWVLMLDDDERLSKKLKNDLHNILEKVNKNFVSIDTLRINLASNKRIILAPYYPDRVIKVFKKDKVIFTGRVHDGPRILGPIYYLPEEYYVIHLPYHERSWIKKTITYTYFQVIQYSSLSGGNLVRRMLSKLLPATTPVYYVYLLAALIVNKKPINYLSIIYTFRRTVYDSFLHILLKTRSKKRKYIADKISKIGFIQLLDLG
ncbi:MAG: glycosyltransferase family 2 protein [Nitrososphaerota archaeon]|nr:glycosyltransferase family 2 protein [Candidatus Aenigmarchaeota archaeon]MDW8034732.1 glycosyltransferase family 2 protein [Nitrososphaerota archaeon]